MMGLKSDVKQIEKALKDVINFNSDTIMRKLRGGNFTSEEMINVKEQCRILADNDIYPFQVDGKTDREICIQITEFINAGLTM